MIKIIDDLNNLKEGIKNREIDVEIDDIIKIDLPFLESQSKFTIINIPSYNNDKGGNIIIVNESDILVWSSLNFNKIDKKFERINKKKNGESTLAIFFLLKSILKNYSLEFLRIRSIMDSLDLDPQLDIIEQTGRELRKVTDRLEGLLQVVIELKEANISCFEPSLVDFEYELFITEVRYWLERGRSHNYRISSLRTKSEMRSNKELNDTMKKLVIITTFLTIVSIVINVPGTIGAIFGIPALSDTYFKNNIQMLVFVLIFMTILSIILGLFYWKSLKLKQ